MTLEIITLRDANIGSAAYILPGFGFNCFRFTAVADGGEIEVLWAEDAFESGARRPSGSGIPILFPFPGRISGTMLEYGGRTYELEAGDGRGNAIHGFVLNRPWRVIEQGDQHVVGQFHASADESTLRNSWPADFRITLAFRLTGNVLAIEARLENPGDAPLPMGFGVHPYFRVPFAPAGVVDSQAAGRCRLRVPAAEYWELADMLATGRRLPSGDRVPLASGVDFAEANFDDVFTALAFDGDWCTSTIGDPQCGRTLRVSFDRAFRECVVYNPPHRQAICIEPYTCVPGAIGLAAQGFDAGLRVLAAGEAMTAQVRIAVV